MLGTEQSPLHFYFPGEPGLANSSLVSSHTHSRRETLLCDKWHKTRKQET